VYSINYYLLVITLNTYSLQIWNNLSKIKLLYNQILTPKINLLLNKKLKINVAIKIVFLLLLIIPIKIIFKDLNIFWNNKCSPIKESTDIA